MRFFKQNGKQHLDLKYDLILTHDDELVVAASKSAAPRKVINGKWIKLKSLGFFRKIQATLHVIKFIWRGKK